MFKHLESARSRQSLSQLERNEREQAKFAIGFRGPVWAGLSLFVILLTVFLILLIDGRSVARAAERGAPWSAAMQSEDWETVRKLAKSAVDKNSSNEAAQHALGVALLELGRLDEAEVPLITAESLAPAVVDYKVALADLYARKNVPSLAAVNLQSALALDPSLVDLHWRLARVLYSLGQHEESLQELRIINTLQPENWDAYRLTADVAMGRKVNSQEESNEKYREAIRNLKIYTAIVPDARSWAKMAFAYMSIVPPDTAGAHKAAATALAINEKDNQANLALARINLIMNKTEPALGYYIEAAKFMIPARDASFAGKILTRDNKLAQAETALRTAAAIDSTNKDYLFDLGKNLISQQKFAETAEVFKRVLDVDPKNTSAYVNWGNAEMAAGDPDKAEEAYMKALKIDDCSAPAHKALGDVYVAKGASTSAMASYRRALECSPDNATGSAAAAALGYVQWQQNDFNAAIPVLKQALDFDRCNLHAILTLANCHQKLGQNEEAIAILRRGQGCDAGNSAIKEALRSLGQ